MPGFFQNSGNEAITELPIIDRTISFDVEFDNLNSGTADTIDWGVKNKQRTTLTGNAVFTFVNPDGPSNLLLKVIQDGTGGRTITWPANVKWPNNGSVPTLSTAAGAIDIVAFYYDGTNYYGNATLTFA